jgi:glycerophosphoryl diester phosphodiesterase
MHDDEIVLPNGQKRAVAGMPLWQLQSLYPRLLLFDDFLEHYASQKRTNIDVKGTGFERELVDRLRHRDLLGSVLISSTFGASLRAIKLLAPEVECGLSRGQFVSWLGREPHSTIAAHALRPTLPVQLAAHGRSALADAFMLHYRLIRPWLVRFLHARGFRVFCWTVNDPDIARTLADAGVDGIASDRPSRVRAGMRSA